MPTTPETTQEQHADQGLSLHHITVRFGGLLALDDVSLSVKPGRVVGIIGPNGAGKTTLFNAICGFVAPQSGAITLDGRPFRPRPHHLNRHGIARTLQGVGQFGGLTVLENVQVGARKSDDDAYAALERCGVVDCADAYPGSLPYAKRKRVELARALASRPRILMLDEPAGGLDAEEITWLAELIRETGETSTVLLVEHHMDLVMSVCDEILVLDFGKPIALGSPGEIRTDPQVAEAYLGTAA
jgi:branched-chain amino acid transport system ATP-binding protein